MIGEFARGCYRIFPWARAATLFTCRSHRRLLPSSNEQDSSPGSFPPTVWLNSLRFDYNQTRDTLLSDNPTTLIQDTLEFKTTHPVRFFVNAPTLTITILATLGLGIGAFIAVFSVVYGVLLKPFPFPDSDRLVQISETIPTRGLFSPVREGTIWDLHDLNRSLKEFGAWHGDTVTMTGLEVIAEVSWR